MKTIEERAREYMSGKFKGPCGSYIQGATDQQNIDIEKACDWLSKEIEFESGIKYSTLDFYNNIENLIADFRKAMKGE